MLGRLPDIPAVLCADMPGCCTDAAGSVRAQWRLSGCSVELNVRTGATQCAFCALSGTEPAAQTRLDFQKISRAGALFCNNRYVAGACERMLAYYSNVDVPARAAITLYSLATILNHWNRRFIRGGC